MVYNYYQGVVKERISKLAMLTIALLFAATAALGVFAPAQAATSQIASFTQSELDDNWETDRLYPSGGVDSVSYAGRDNVAKIGILGEGQSEDPFYQFEGIKKVGDFGGQVQVDLYVPSEWQEVGVVNVGFWASDSPLSAYPLVVYRNGANIEAGFYTWDVVYNDETDEWEGVYNLSDSAVKYDNWNTLSIMLDAEDTLARYTINGDDAGSMYASGDFINQVFLNHYNDGQRDYFAYWHAGLESPINRGECKKGGFADFGFRNQGLCIQYVNTGRDSR